MYFDKAWYNQAFGCLSILRSFNRVKILQEQIEIKFLEAKHKFEEGSDKIGALGSKEKAQIILGKKVLYLQKNFPKEFLVIIMDTSKTPLEIKLE